jgi:integrase
MSTSSRPRLRLRGRAFSRDRPAHGGISGGRAAVLYGFHDLRRAFATMNADKLTPDTLQTLMRHKSYTTAQRYINMARQMDAAVASLHVPDVLKTGS